MDTNEFWGLIERARAQAGATASPVDVVRRATALLSGESAHTIEAADRTFHELMARSYRIELWGAAYLLHGGCSDDCFEYFRGWLIAQGRAVYEAALAEPDSLADLDDLTDVECEQATHMSSDAYRAATGFDPPDNAVEYPELNDAQDWDFDDEEENRRRLPRLTDFSNG